MLRWICVLVVLGLAACVPATESERVEVNQLTEEISFYPQQTGAQWLYLEENVPLDSLPIQLTVEGPIIIDGEIWVKTRLVGQGLDSSDYRQYRSDGVYLLRKDRPGTQITFEPPIRQYPEVNGLRVGLSWTGETQASLYFPEAQAENQRSQVNLDYTYTVVDQRTIVAPAGEFEVYVINFVTRTFDENANIVEELTQEVWFSPFIGEVRTEQAYFLVASNILTAVE